jgi:hypothetical protein
MPSPVTNAYRFGYGREHVRLFVVVFAVGYCRFSNTKIAMMFAFHVAAGRHRSAAPGDEPRWSDGCYFAAETARRGRRRPLAKGQSGNPSSAAREEFPGKSGKHGDGLSGLMVSVGEEPMS